MSSLSLQKVAAPRSQSRRASTTVEGADRPYRSVKYSALWSAAFTAAFVFIPWPDIWYRIYTYPMVDRYRYFEQIVNHNLRSDYFQYQTPLSLYTDEWLWSELLKFLVRTWGWTPDDAFLLISSMVIFAFSYLVFRHAPAYYALVLVNPLVVDFAFSQLRSALAVALLLFAYMAYKKFWPISVALAGIALFIHSATPLFLIFFVVSLWRGHSISKVRSYWTLVAIVLCGFAVSLATGPLRGTILSALNDRRVEYPEIASSAAFLSFWLLMLVAIVVLWPSLALSFSVRIVTLVMAITAMNLATDGYSTRFIVAIFPFIAIALYHMSLRLKALPLVAFVVYSTLQWVYWTRLNETFG